MIYYLFIISIIIIKMKRDKKGRFIGKDDDNRVYQFAITFPSIRNKIFLVLIIIIVSPWALIFKRSNLLQKLWDFFENILIPKEESEVYVRWMFIIKRIKSE